VIGRLVESVSGDDLDTEILSEETLYIGAGADSRWHRRRRIDAAELIGEPWALPAYDSSFVGPLVKEAFQAKGLDPPPIAVVTFSMHLLTALMATSRFLSVWSASMQLSAKRLPVKALPVDLQIRPLRNGIVTLKNRTISPVAQLFIESARKVARPFVKTR
jgi:DNA-binding transcriptional LysR family regulator